MNTLPDFCNDLCMLILGSLDFCQALRDHFTETWAHCSRSISALACGHPRCLHLWLLPQPREEQQKTETARYMWIDSKTWATFPSCSDLDQDLPPGWLWFTKSKSKHVPASLILAKFRCVSAKEWSVRVLKKGDIYVAYYSSWMNQSRVWAHLQL